MGEFCDSVSLGPTKLEEFKLVLKGSLKKKSSHYGSHVASVFLSVK